MFVAEQRLNLSSMNNVSLFEVVLVICWKLVYVLNRTEDLLVFEILSRVRKLWIHHISFFQFDGMLKKRIDANSCSNIPG